MVNINTTQNAITQNVTKQIQKKIRFFLGGGEDAHRYPLITSILNGGETPVSNAVLLVAFGYLIDSVYRLLSTSISTPGDTPASHVSFEPLLTATSSWLYSKLIHLICIALSLECLEFVEQSSRLHFHSSTSTSLSPSLAHVRSTLFVYSTFSCSLISSLPPGLKSFCFANTDHFRLPTSFKTAFTIQVRPETKSSVLIVFYF